VGSKTTFSTAADFPPQRPVAMLSPLTVLFFSQCISVSCKTNRKLFHWYKLFPELDSEFKKFVMNDSENRVSVECLNST